MIEILVAVLLVYFGYKWYINAQLSKRLDWINGVPGLPIFGNILQFGKSEEFLYKMQDMMRKYGTVLKLEIFKEPRLFVADYDMIEFLLGTHSVLNKSEEYLYLHKWLGTGLLTSDGPKWKGRRRMMTPAFHFSILEKFIECFDANGKILVKKLEKEVGKESVDIYPFLNLYTLDVICETAMGISVNAQKNEDSNYVNDVREESRIVTERSLQPMKMYDFTYKLTPDFYKEINYIRKLHRVTNSVIDARTKEFKEKQTVKQETDDLGRKKRMAFLDILLNSTVDGQPLSREDIREEVDTFMFEGHDTTSSAVSFTLYLLAGHPEIQKRVVEEQEQIFSDDINRDVTYNDLSEMKYLELVIKESLRLYPPVPAYGRCTNQDVEYKGNVIPKGVNITIFAYGLHRDPNIYPDPEKFDPSRFETFDGKRPYNYVPFSAGARNCIGQKFAMLEIKSSLSKVVRNFELYPTVPEHKMILVPEVILKSLNGVKIRLAKRKW